MDLARRVGQAQLGFGPRLIGENPVAACRHPADAGLRTASHGRPFRTCGPTPLALTEEDIHAPIAAG